jgi:arylsulfatase A-like enzyme
MNIKAVCLMLPLSLCCGLLSAAEDRPNILFMMVDDLGKECVSCYGSESIETPHIDKLAAGGMLFHNAYSMPQCIPTRVCIMTGQYPSTNGWVDHWDPPLWGRAYLDWRCNPILGNILRTANYKTCVVGKWQLTNTETMPHSVYDLGFDEYFVWARSRKPELKGKDGRYWDPHFFSGKGRTENRNTKYSNGEYGPDLCFDFATDFMRRHKESPFFVYYAFNLVHSPFCHTPLEKTPERKFSAMVRYMDHLMGDMVAFLEKEGLRKNTIIVWTTDNGSPGSVTHRLNGREVKGGKTKTTENGIDAPFIVNCPGMVPSGVETQALLDFTDLVPTFADFAGAKLPEKYKFDGVSQREVMTGKKKESPRDWIVGMGGKPLRAVNTDGRVVNRYYYRDRVIKNGRYKLFVGADRQPEKLYDLEKDPGEETNLLADPEHKETVAELLKYAHNNFAKVDNDPQYEPFSNPWDPKPNAQKPVLTDPDDPNRPLTVRNTGAGQKKKRGKKK